MYFVSISSGVSTGDPVELGTEVERLYLSKADFFIGGGCTDSPDVLVGVGLLADVGNATGGCD